MATFMMQLQAIVRDAQTAALKGTQDSAQVHEVMGHVSFV